jgi:hypothetical protein
MATSVTRATRIRGWTGAGAGRGPARGGLAELGYSMKDSSSSGR